MKVQFVVSLLHLKANWPLAHPLLEPNIHSITCTVIDLVIVEYLGEVPNSRISNLTSSTTTIFNTIELIKTLLTFVRSQFFFFFLVNFRINSLLNFI